MRKNVIPILDKVNDKMFIINQYNESLDANITYITFNPTAGFTVGLKLTFASETITIDWKDGSAAENFTSGTTKTHTFTNAGTYRSEISGSLTNITRFEMNNAVRVTKIQNLKTGSLANITLTNQLMTNETLDLTNSPLANNAAVLVTGNGIDYIKFASSNGTVTYIIRLYGNDLKTIDLSNVPISNEINFNNQSALTGITFKSSGNGILRNINFSSCNLNYINLASGGMSLAENNCQIQLQNNAMGVADVNHILVDLYSLVSGEPDGGSYTGRAINIGGTNDAPDASSGGYDGLTAKSNLEGKGFTVIVSI